MVIPRPMAYFTQYIKISFKVVLKGEEKVEKNDE